MDARHTPTPWCVDATKALGAYGVWTKDADPRNPGHDGRGYQVQICSMNPSDRDTPIKKDERNANAEYIVRACNAHDGLVSACQSMRDFLGELLGFYPESHPDAGLIRAEIARADRAIAGAYPWPAAGRDVDRRASS